nr:hypothetical protein CE91St29_12490 [Corynebacterium striatum]
MSIRVEKFPISSLPHSGLERYKKIQLKRGDEALSEIAQIEASWVWFRFFYGPVLMGWVR